VTAAANDPESDTAQVIAANAELYAAIELGDADRIAAMWDDADDVVCVHLGWPAVVGRSRVLRSWAVILANTAYIQFVTTGTDVAITGDVAIVSCEYGVLARSDEADTGFGESARIVASNVFRRRALGWRLWSHHASPVLSDDAGDDERGER
jgi:ketosteroid isomerase-like protein